MENARPAEEPLAKQNASGLQLACGQVEEALDGASFISCKATILKKLGVSQRSFPAAYGWNGAATAKDWACEASCVKGSAACLIC